MDKRICPFCKEKIKEKATICKHCRSQVPPLLPKKRSQIWVGFFFTWVFLSIIVLAFKELPTIISSHSSSVQSSPTINKKKVSDENETNIDEKKAEKEAREKAEREAQTKEILAKLKGIPTSQFQKNRDLYQKLVTYYPDNEKYIKKLDFYSAKIKEQQEKEHIKQEKLKKEHEKRIALFGKPPVQSAWDGSYYEVERYLKRVANDPNSIKIDGCTKVYRTESGWLVGCDYRGRNAFGGLIRQSNWFSIVYGTVIQMHDSSSYNP